MKRLIIQASARSHGNTHQIAKALIAQIPCDLVDLNELHIQPFDYEFKNQEDDFRPLMQRISSDYDLLIFATPIYWYSMSGLLKTFFDRITDCLMIEKNLGRSLRGKKMAMLYCGNDNEPIAGFEMPFRLSADYLGMTYLGDIHTWIEEESVCEQVQTQIENFAHTLQKA